MINKQSQNKLSQGISNRTLIIIGKRKISSTQFSSLNLGGEERGGENILSSSTDWISLVTHTNTLTFWWRSTGGNGKSNLPDICETASWRTSLTTRTQVDNFFQMINIWKSFSFPLSQNLYWSHSQVSCECLCFAEERLHFPFLPANIIGFFFTCDFGLFEIIRFDLS